MPAQRSSAMPIVILLVVAALAAAWWLSGNEPDATLDLTPAPAQQVDELQTELPSSLDSSEQEPERLDAGLTTGLVPEAPPQVGWAGEDLIVKGYVRDLDEVGQGDVDVNLFDALGEFLDAEVTDDDGYFELSWDETMLAGWSVGTDPDPYADYDDPYALAPTTVVINDAWNPGDAPRDIELVLQRAPRIRGRVLDANTGLPVDFADIEVVSTHPAWVDAFQDTFSEDDGTFEMSIVELPREQLIVRAMDDDGNTATAGPFDLAPSEVRFVELLIEGGTNVAGVVRNQSGLPVDGAEVVLIPLHPDLDEDHWDITLEDGGFLFEGVGGQSRELLLYTQADGYGPQIAPIDPKAGAIDVTLGPLVTVAGTIVDAETGEPIDGADITFTLQGPGGLIEDYEDYAYTELDGRFQVDMEYVPVEAARVLIETLDHQLYVTQLSELVDVNTGALFYEAEISLTPNP